MSMCILIRNIEKLGASSSSINDFINCKVLNFKQGIVVKWTDFMEDLIGYRWEEFADPFGNVI